MNKDTGLKFDEIGYWSEIKLDIVRDYAAEYSKILAAQKNPVLYHVYIDGFAGSGIHISKNRGELVPGSPLNALQITPPFREYYLIDLDSQKVSLLKQIVGSREDVHILEGDANRLLIEEVFPNVSYKEYRRGLCLLDPYGLHLNWEVLSKAGQMGSIDMFLNFPVADINRNVIWRDPTGVRQSDIKRMDMFWGDDSWRKIAYRPVEGLFETIEEKVNNETVAEAFRERLRCVAGFKHVPKPLPMRNSKGAIVYYLFFASQKPVAEKIIQHIFNKYRNRGVS